MQNSVLQIMKNLTEADSIYLLSKVQKAEEKGYIKKPTLQIIQHFHQSFQEQAQLQQEDNLKFKNKNYSKSLQKYISKIEMQEAAKTIEQYYSRYQSLIKNNQNYKSEFEQYLNETIRKKQKRIDEEVIGKNGNKKNSRIQNEQINNNNNIQKIQQALQANILQQNETSLKQKEIINNAIKNMNQNQSIQINIQKECQIDIKDAQIMKGKDGKQIKQIQVMEQQTQENSQSFQNEQKNINQDTSQIQGGKQFIKGNIQPFKIKQQRNVIKQQNEKQIMLNQLNDKQIMLNESEQKFKDFSAIYNQQKNQVFEQNPTQNIDIFKKNIENPIQMQNQSEYSQEYYQRPFYDNQYLQQYPQYHMGQQEYPPPYNNTPYAFDPQNIPQDLYEEMISCDILQKKLTEDIMNKNYEVDGLSMDQRIQYFQSRKKLLEEKIKHFQQMQSYLELEFQKKQNLNKEISYQYKEDILDQESRKGSRELEDSKQASNGANLGKNRFKIAKSPIVINHLAYQQKQIEQKKMLQLQQERLSIEDSQQQQQKKNKKNYQQIEQTQSELSSKETNTLSMQKAEGQTKEKTNQKSMTNNKAEQINKISDETYNQINITLNKNLESIKRQPLSNGVGYQNQLQKSPYLQPHHSNYDYFAHHLRNNSSNLLPPTYGVSQYEKSPLHYQPPYQSPNQIDKSIHNKSQNKQQIPPPPPYQIPSQQQPPLNEIKYSKHSYPKGLEAAYYQHQQNEFQPSNIKLQNLYNQQQIQQHLLLESPNIENENVKLSKQMILYPPQNPQVVIQPSQSDKQIKEIQIQEIESSESDVQVIDTHQKIIQEIKN